MIIYNLKLNKKTIFKTCLAIMSIVCISIAVAGIYNLMNNLEKKDNNIINDSIPSSEVAVIEPANYTNILKQVHENLDTYVGQKISFTGYVYRLNSFSDEQFVLARDMDIGNRQTLIVGFLCSLKNAKEYPTYSWVKVTGEITKGYYNGEIPLINVTAIEMTQKPDNATVPLPDDEYVPTAVIY